MTIFKIYDHKYKNKINSNIYNYTYVYARLWLKSENLLLNIKMNDFVTSTFRVQNPEINNVGNVLKDYIENTITDLYNSPLYVGGNCAFHTIQPFFPSRVLQLSPKQQ